MRQTHIEYIALLSGVPPFWDKYLTNDLHVTTNRGKAGIHPRAVADLLGKAWHFET